MKKNLRIVSAAAAALLAVAPVAATVVPAASTTVSAAADQQNSAKGTYVVAHITAYDINNGKATVNQKLTDQFKKAFYDTPVAVNNVSGNNTSSAKIEGQSRNKTFKAFSLNGTTFWLTDTDAKNFVVESEGSIADTTINHSLPAAKKGETLAKYKQAVVNAIPVDALPKLGDTSANAITVDDVAVLKDGAPVSNFKPEDASKYTVVITAKYKVKTHAMVNGKLTSLQNKVAGTIKPAEIQVVVNGNSSSNNNGSSNNGNQTTNPSKPSSSASVNAGNGTSIFDNTAVNTTIALNAVAKKDGIRGSLNGNIAVTLNGKSYTALLVNDANGQNTTVYEKDSKGNWSAVKPADMVANRKYFAQFNDVRVNLGNEYANKDVTINLPAASWFGTHDAAANAQKRTKKVHVDENGVAKLDTITSQFYAYDATDARGINFFDINTGDVVKSGTVNLHAVNGQLNVESIYRAINAQYRAEQVIDNNLDKNVSLLDDIKAQLVKQNIPVGPNGYFKAQTPINLTVTAKSNTNGATATLPVTVNVDNVTATAAQETTKTVTIMHISTIYDKNGKATHEPALRAYDTYSVVATPVNLKDEKGKDAGMFYKLAGKDQYIKVGNVDGTKRSLKKNSYVYKSTGKAYMKSKKHHRVLKAGSSVTTYGKSFMIAGHQMYRIGKNQYVKKANF